MTKQLITMFLVGALAACGGTSGGADSSESTTPLLDRSNQGPINDSDSADDMVPPEKMEEINKLLSRKQGIMSRCYADAVERGEAGKNSRGRMSVEILISPAGKAETVTVARSSFDATGVTPCVVGHIKSIQFPELPRPFPTSFTYAFEAM